jgi:hypothetical protein
MSFAPSEEFTPTWEEYVYSHVPTWHNLTMRVRNLNPWGPRDEEKAFYHAVDSWLLLGATAAHASHVGWYAATNTVHAYRLMQAASRASMLANPAVLATAAVVGGGAYVGHKIMTTEQGDPWYHMLQTLGENINLSV